MSHRIPWFGAQMGREEETLVLDVLRSNYINDGDVTRRFEREIAQLIDAKYCVGVTSGTAAIALALIAAGVKPGDEVLVPDMTFIATANAVRLMGAEVKLVDIEPQRLSIDPDKLSKALTRKTAAIVPVDVNGRGAYYEELVPFAKRKGLALICDSAEALGSKYRGKSLGTYGDAGCFSFSPNKTITTGQGGMVATNNKELYHRLLELKDQGRRFQGTGGDDKHPVMGYNFKLTNVQSAIGLGQYRKLKARLSKGHLREGWYRDLLKDVEGLTFLDWNSTGGEHLQWTDVLVEKREQVLAQFDRHGIGHRRFWYPLHTQKPYSRQKGRFPVSRRVSAQGVWLPSHFNITFDQVRFVAHILKKALH